jgi:TPR repeat protein
VNAAKEKIVGEGIAKDTNAGVAELDAMCTRGTVEGCKALANAYETGLGDVQPSESRSGEYLTKACELHDKESCGKAHLQKTGTLTATMPARINAALRDQCDAGRMKSCEMLGRNLSNGTGVPKDEAAGAEYLKKACKGGETTACGVGGR